MVFSSVQACDILRHAFVLQLADDDMLRVGAFFMVLVWAVENEWIDWKHGTLSDGRSELHGTRDNMDRGSKKWLEKVSTSVAQDL